MLLKGVLIYVHRIIVCDTGLQQDSLRKQGWGQITSGLEQLNEYPVKSAFH